MSDTLIIMAIFVQCVSNSANYNNPHAFLNTNVEALLCVQCSTEPFSLATIWCW